MRKATTFPREVRDLYAIIGGVVSAGSVISLVTRYLRVGLSPILAEFVAYYRSISHFFVEWLTFWLPFQLPDWYKDSFVISFVFIVLLLRTYRSIVHPTLPHYISLPMFFLLSICLSIPLLGFLYFLHPLVGDHIARYTNPAFDLLSPEEQKKIIEEIPFSRMFHTSIISLIVAVVAFFALNSQL